jgi:hypothetical protein
MQSYVLHSADLLFAQFELGANRETHKDAIKIGFISTPSRMPGRYAIANPQGK